MNNNYPPTSNCFLHRFSSMQLLLPLMPNGLFEFIYNPGCATFRCQIVKTQEREEKFSPVKRKEERKERTLYWITFPYCTQARQQKGSKKWRGLYSDMLQHWNSQKENQGTEPATHKLLNIIYIKLLIYIYICLSSAVNDGSLARAQLTHNTNIH